MTAPHFDPERSSHAPQQLQALNAWLATQSAEQRVQWGLAHLPQRQVISSSFGAQSAVSLHLLSQQQPDIAVIVIDTGYLFAETYRFIDQLREQLQLNLIVVRPELSPGWLEARYGRLWEQGLAGLEHYNQLVKIEPMRKLLTELEVGTWYAGLRRQQAESRAQRDYLEVSHGRYKLHPILDWSDREIGQYLQQHELPYHPLWAQGYVSIGDVHTSVAYRPGMRAEDTRFFGLKRECGLHLEV